MPSTWQGKALIGNQEWAASWGLREAGVCFVESRWAPRCWSISEVRNWAKEKVLWEHHGGHQASQALGWCSSRLPRPAMSECCLFGYLHRMAMCAPPKYHALHQGDLVACFKHWEVRQATRENHGLFPWPFLLSGFLPLGYPVFPK